MTLMVCWAEGGCFGSPYRCLETFEMFNSHTRRSRITHPAFLQRAALSPVPQHRKVPNMSKTGLSNVRTATGSWRRQESSQQVSTERRPKRSVDLLELRLAKPKNCHRIVVLGAPKVGKTNILRRFLGKEFEEKYEPTSEDFHRKLFHIGGKAYQLDLLDAAGERSFPAKRRLSILTGDSFLLAFSLDDRESFDEVCRLYSEINVAKAKMQRWKHPARIKAVVCGNKADLDAPRAVRRSDVAEFLGEDVAFVETSAKDGTGLDDAFRALAALGGLPDATVPSQHRLVSILTYRSLCVSRTRGLGAPCAAADPLARRPSFTSDLQLVLKSKHNKPERCHIQ
ncbi:GTP-binding protein Rhes [Brachionichthys hirsutus]|uniref:GTP-binding protein Rhes n=1 Tax=Brachionichthys hirsutus TaxID=412623 RepID=UPI0036046944